MNTPNPLRLARFFATAAILTATSSAFAATYQWDTNGSSAGLGGAGTWDASTPNWDLVGTGADTGTDATTAYTFTNADTATFGGTGGAVNITSAVTVNRLWFTSTGYTLSGSAITLAGTSPKITTDADATITSVVSGNGLTMNGAGALTLAGNNTNTGTFTIDGGTVKVTGYLYGAAYADTQMTIKNGGTLELSNWNYGLNAGSLGDLKYDNCMVIDNGTIRMTNATAQAYTRYFTVNSGGVTLDAGGSALWTLQLSNPGRNIIFNGNAALTLTGNGTGGGQFDHVFSGGGTLTKNGTGTWTLTAANTHTGGTVVNAGTLTIAATTGSIKVGAGAAGITIASGATLAVNGALVLTAQNATITNSGGSIAFAASGSSINIGAFFDSGYDGSAYQLISGGGITNWTSVGVTGYSTSVWSSVALDSAGKLNFVSAVPEPSAYGLVGAGALAGIAVVRRRRRRMV